MYFVIHFTTDLEDGYFDPVISISDFYLNITVTVTFDIFFLQEENDVTEFFLILEKDPQQEDFLQGRMLGNPYSSTEPGMGPLMRDIKNKICMGKI